MSLEVEGFRVQGSQARRLQRNARMPWNFRRATAETPSSRIMQGLA